MLKYHQFRGRLNMGDLHPGGAGATGKMLEWLGERNVRRVLEVGAGIGNTAARMTALGWDVTALEPDPILFATLRRRMGDSARCEPFLSHETAIPYDAIIAESVFFQMDLAQTFRHAHTLLRPGGHLAFVEAVWTGKIDASGSKQLHDATRQLFGIAVGSSEPLTWHDWSGQLQNCRFETERAERLPRGSAGHPPTSRWYYTILAVARDPRLAVWMARYRMRKRLVRMPPGVQESWLFLGKKADAGVL
jgi:SAM-dependent methyltransferase